MRYKMPMKVLRALQLTMTNGEPQKRRGYPEQITGGAIIGDTTQIKNDKPGDLSFGDSCKN
jgi:hypothetical protein